MLSPTEKVYQLVASPLASLIESWQVKLPVATVLGVLWQKVLYVLGLYASAIGRHSELMLLTGAIVACDLAAGLVRAWRDGQSIKSGHLRATGWKVIEYAAVVIVGLLVSDAIRHSAVVPDAAAIWGQATMIYICITEGVSCYENAVGKKRADHMLPDLPEIKSQNSDE
jgi:hypothetical protein